MRRSLIVVGAFLLVCSAGAVQGQTPLGGEFRVNEFTTAYQRTPAVAADPTGNFIVVWSSDLQDADILGRLYDAEGNPKGSEFHVNPPNAFGQAHPAAAFDSAGNFVVVWSSFNQDGSTAGVFGRRFDAQGIPLTAEFQVNTYTTNYQSKARVATGPGGMFVVVWESYREDGSETGVFGQRFDAAGNRLGSAFQANTYTTSNQGYPDVAMEANGNFVVVWESETQDTGLNNFGIYAQRYDFSGNRVGGEFLVNTITTGNQINAKVAADPHGGFVVAWASSDADSFGVWARRYDAQGAPGPDFLVNTTEADTQFWPSVALDANSNLVAAWQSLGQDGDNYGIATRQHDCDGQGLANDAIVNTYTTGYQARPRVAAAAGNYVVTWLSDGQDGDRHGVYARRYRGLPACGRFHAVAPCRLADTRTGPPLAANDSRDFPATAACTVPADARALALNVTVAGPTDAGNLRVYPAGIAAPLASAINFVPNAARANSAVVRVGTGGRVTVRCDMAPGSAGSTHVILDVYGYFR